MKKTKESIYIKARIAILIVLAVSILCMLLYVPPDNWKIILFFITVSSFFAFAVSTFFFSNATSIVIALFFFLLLIINGLVGFDIVNSILLLCFMIGIKFLVQ